MEVFRIPVGNSFDFFSPCCHIPQPILEKNPVPQSSTADLDHERIRIRAGDSINDRCLIVHPKKIRP